MSGLIRRMAMDRCLPQFLLYTNKLRGTVHFIIIGFFLVTSSLCILMRYFLFFARLSSTERLTLAQSLP